MTQAPDSQDPAGYVSAGAKRHFTILAGVLGTAAFVLQIAVPMVLMILLMFAMMPSPGSPKFVQADRGAFWDGQLWLVQEGMRVGATPGEILRSASSPETVAAQAMSPKLSRSLMALAPGPEAALRQADTLDAANPWLLAGPDRLWIISPAKVCNLQGGLVCQVGGDQQLGDLSRPFLYGGQPAVIEFRPDGQALRVFKNKAWASMASVQLRMPDAGPLDADDLQVVAIDETVHLFLQSGRTVYYQKAPATWPAENAPWEAVRETRGNWSAAAVGGRPALFLYEDAKERFELVGLRPGEGGWRPFFTRPVKNLFEASAMRQAAWASDNRRSRGRRELGVVPAGGDDFMLVIGGQPFGGRVVEVRGGREVRQTRLGGGFPFPRGFFPLMMLPYLAMFLVPLGLAFVLSALMARYRTPVYRSGEATVAYAPLWRRALAEVVDLAVLGAPMAGGVVAAMILFSDFEAAFDFSDGFPFKLLLPHLLTCGGVFWAIAFMGLYSFTEGRWGTTLGKWLFGIRVWGTDLAPCGFGRALVRNLLRVVDGFFNFLVGTLLVALTENRQRLGDLAARTVVVMAAPRQGTRTGNPET